MAKLAKRNIRLDGDDSQESQNEFNKVGVTGYAYFYDQNVLIMLMSILVEITNPEEMYMFRKPFGYHEVLLSYHMRRDLDEERKNFVRRV